MADSTKAATHDHNPNSGSVVQPDFHGAGAEESVSFSTVGDWEKEVTRKPPSYAEPLFRPDVAKSIEEEMESLSNELRELSLKIHGAFLGSSSTSANGSSTS